MGKDLGFFSPEFRNLFTMMVLDDPDWRLGIEEIKEHPWFKKDDLPTPEEVTREMLMKKEVGKERLIQIMKEQSLREKKERNIFAGARATAHRDSNTEQFQPLYQNHFEISGE
jgi:hypothetical protein